MCAADMHPCMLNQSPVLHSAADDAVPRAPVLVVSARQQHLPPAGPCACSSRRVSRICPRPSASCFPARPQIGMELWAQFAHKALWHDFEPGWALHKSHHAPRLGPFEDNDVFAIVNAIPAMSLCAYGFLTPGVVGGEHSLPARPLLHVIYPIRLAMESVVLIPSSAAGDCCLCAARVSFRFSSPGTLSPLTLSAAGLLSIA